MEDLTTIEIRMDSETAARVKALYAEAGTTFEEAVRTFAEQSIMIGTPLALPRKVMRQRTAFGCLERFVDPKIRIDEEGAFARAAAENYSDTD